jgi:DNA-binding CsgD family transcriptional regulator
MRITDGIVRGRVEMPLIGRQAELDRLVGLVLGTSRATPRVVLIRGEAGIGKSHLMRRAIDELVGDGWTVLDVHATQLDRLVPYAGLRHAVATHEEMLGKGLSELATRLVRTLDVTGERSLAAVHAAAVRFFSALTDERPTVLAFDDLELVEEDTVTLVASLLRLRERHPLVAVGNLRKPSGDRPHALAALVDQLRSDVLVDEVELGPLDDEAIERIVSALIDEPPDKALVSAVQQQSGGNPLFAVESALNLARARGGRGEARFTGDRRRAFLDRVLRDVAPDARRLGSAIALLGAVGHERIELAAELAGLSAAQADAAFDGLVDAGVLQTATGGGYRVGHQLLEEALVQQVGPAERWRWHRVAADRLQELPPSPALDLEVAGHVREVAEVGDARAIAVLSRAAERTCAAAPRSSIPWFEEALRIAPFDDPVRALLLARLARALFLAGRLHAAMDTGRTALTGMPEGETRRRLVTLVVAALLQASAFDEAAELVDRELARPGDRAWLAAQAAHVYGTVGREAEAAASAEVGERRLASAVPSERIVGLIHLAHMGCMRPSYDELVARWREIEQVADNAPPTAQLGAHAAVGFMRATHGYTREASGSIARAQELLAETGWTLYRADVAAAQAQNAAHLGDWSFALSIVEPIAEELVNAGSLVDLMALRATETDILANRGAWTAARRAADLAPTGAPHYDALRDWSCAGIDLLSGSHAAAAESLERRLEDPFIPRWIRALLSSRLADVESERGRSARAAELLGDAILAGHNVLNPPTYVAVRLSWGQATGSVDALRDAQAVADKHGLELLRGQARWLLGVHDVDPESTLVEAATIFQRLGAVPWRRRAVVELRARGLKIPRQRTRNPALLTETELQIARLVQQGHGNREIAMTMFLQVKTVEAYLTRIYRKVGVRSRLELARAVDAGRIG